MYEYSAKLDRVVDGDTIDVKVDLGFNMRRIIRLRLNNVDTHETYGVDKKSEEYLRGKTETEFVKDWFTVGTYEQNFDWPFIVTTYKTGKYGRYVADVERKSDGSILNEALLSEFDDISI